MRKTKIKEVANKREREKQVYTMTRYLTQSSMQW